MNRDKVVKGLEICYIPPSSCDNCPYKEQEECNDSLCRDALAMLKEDCHNCKLECLLQKYDQLKEKYDKLLKEREALLNYGR